MDIIKASGKKEKFNKEKLYRSIKRAGASIELAEKVSREISKKVFPGMSSWQILDQVTHSLRKESPILACRYNLKRAIRELGPTGFPFEKYVAEILREYGYDVAVGKMVKGYCVTHEVDIIARKDKKHFMVECKYHNSPGNQTDVKAALYIYARFLDVKAAWEKLPGHQHFFHQAWLVTNTKCTTQAIQYGRCRGLKIISWRYPPKEGLEYMIEKKGLYPVTVLPSLKPFLKEKLSETGFVLAKDLLRYPVNKLSSILGFPLGVIQSLREEAQSICFAGASDKNRIY